MSGANDNDSYEYGDDGSTIESYEDVRGENVNEYEERGYEEVGAQVDDMNDDDDDGASHLTKEDFGKGVATDEFWVHISGTMNCLGEIAGQAEWTPEPGSEHIFQMIEGVVDGVPKMKGDLKQGVLLGAQWDYVESTFPVDVALDMSGVVGMVRTAQGKHHSVIVPAGKTVKPKRSCFRPTDCISRNMLETFNLYNAKNLNNDVKREDGESWSYVKKSSPVISLIRANRSYFKVQMTLPSGSEGFVKVPNKIIDTCMKFLKEKQQVPFTNFNKFKVVATRTDGREFNNPEGVVDDISGHDMGDKEYIQSVRMNNECHIKALLVLTRALYRGGDNEKA